MERVLADDFSGAAEVAGVGFRYGLTANVHLDPRLTLACRLAVFETDSRSRCRAEAVRLVRSVLDLDWAFKKIDSVLRGHVIAEIEPFLKSGCYRRAIVVPFNPGLRRTISDGVYRIDGLPISQTSFREDPEHPAVTSDVRAMLGACGDTVRICRLSHTLPETGIIVGEGETPEHLRAWAGRVDGSTLPVGGAPFFAAWLESRGRTAGSRQVEEVGSKVLVVSGTTSRVVDWPRIRPNGEIRVLPMPEAVFQRGSSVGVADWANEVALALEDTGFAIATIGPARPLDRSQSGRLVRHLSQLAVCVLDRCPLDQLWLEGGATASAVIRDRGWTSLAVVGELAPGVVQLRAPSGGPLITVKPGSYPWWEQS